MTPHLIIILSLSASTVGFALLAGYWRRQARSARAQRDKVLDTADALAAVSKKILEEKKRLHGWYVIAYDRQQAALACLTPHSANIGRRMARKLRGEP